MLVIKCLSALSTISLYDAIFDHLVLTEDHYLLHISFLKFWYALYSSHFNLCTYLLEASRIERVAYFLTTVNHARFELMDDYSFSQEFHSAYVRNDFAQDSEF